MSGGIDSIEILRKGNAKRLGKDYQRHLKMAAGSLAELETQIELCVRLKFLTRDNVRDTWTTSQHVARLLSGLISSLT